MRAFWIGASTAVLMVAGCGPVDAETPAAETPGEQRPLLEPCMSAPQPRGPTTTAASVELCHRPSSSHGPRHTMTVAAEAVSAHLAHGDTLGACGRGTCAQAGIDCMAIPCCPGLACLQPGGFQCTEDAFGGCTCQVLLY